MLGPHTTDPDQLVAAMDSQKADEITGIYFQKVDAGNVKAAIPLDSFAPVRWADGPANIPPVVAPSGQQAYIRNLHDRLDLGHIEDEDVMDEWREFTDAMVLVKKAMLSLVSICISRKLW